MIRRGWIFPKTMVFRRIDAEKLYFLGERLPRTLAFARDGGPAVTHHAASSSASSTATCSIRHLRALARSVLKPPYLPSALGHGTLPFGCFRTQAR